MRKVIYSEYVPAEKGPYGRVIYKLEEKGEAVFHQFGVAYEEFESGPGNYTTAIIELADGSVKSIPAEQIRFIAPAQGEKEKS